MRKLLATYLFLIIGFISIGQTISINEKSIIDSLSIGKTYSIEVSLNNIDSTHISFLDTAYYKKNESKFNFIYAKLKTENEVEFLINSFDTGYVLLGPFGIVNKGKDTIFSKPILRYFKYAKVDPTKGFKKELSNIQFELTTQEKVILLFVKYWWIFILLISISIGVYLLFKRKRKPAEKVIEVPKVSLKEEYLELLNDINAKELWQKGKIKIYHTEVTFAIRSYISKRYRINALEKTSTQISSSLKSELLNDELKHKMTFLLTLSDMVKFAKEKPTAEENERIIDIAKEFITQTHKEG